MGFAAKNSSGRFGENAPFGPWRPQQCRKAKVSMDAA
jgi:hypothetical protein